MVNVKVESRIKDIITKDGKEFRDLNGNGIVDTYENWELPVEERVQDLISRMTLEEKGGLMTVSSQYMPHSEKCRVASKPKRQMKAVC